MTPLLKMRNLKQKRQVKYRKYWARSAKSITGRSKVWLKGNCLEWLPCKGHYSLQISQTSLINISTAIIPLITPWWLSWRSMRVRRTAQDRQNRLKRRVFVVIVLLLSMKKTIMKGMCMKKQKKISHPIKSHWRLLKTLFKIFWLEITKVNTVRRNNPLTFWKQKAQNMNSPRKNANLLISRSTPQNNTQRNRSPSPINYNPHINMSHHKWQTRWRDCFLQRRKFNSSKTTTNWTKPHSCSISR